MIYAVDSAKSLVSALGAAKSGDTILLESGSYSNVQLKGFVFDGAVTIASKDPADPAVFTGLGVANCQGLSFNNIELDFTSPWTVWNAQINGSKNIELNNVDMHGSLNGSPADDQSGLLIRNSTDVKVTGSEFQQLDHGISLVESTGVRIEGNEFHDMRADGIVSAGTSNVQIVGNSFTDFYPVTGDHPDAIQFLTRGTTHSAENIVISNNLIARGEGAVTQGIFMTDQVGTLPYQNVSIINNVVIGAMYNAIAIANSANLTLTGNTVAAYGDIGSYIQVFNTATANVSNNEAMKINFSNVTGLTNTGNSLISPLTAEVIARLNEWLISSGGADGASLVIDGSASAPSQSAPIPAPEPSAEPTLLLGTSGDDRLIASGKADARLEGGDGNDVLVGGAHVNTLIGGAGNDVYTIRDADDVVVEVAGGGVDIVYASVDYTLTDNVEVLKMLDGAAVGMGNDLGNGITGTTQSDLISGLGGDDDLRGRGGNDTILGGDGDDVLIGEAGADRLEGGAGADRLYGGDGDDVLIGGDGNDRLEGGPGSDILIGGLGADAFNYRPGDLSGVDRIMDFSSAQGDRILLAGIDANALTAVNDKFAFIGANAFSGKAGELRFQVINGDAHVYGDLNGDRVADFEITVVGVTKLSATDFML